MKIAKPTMYTTGNSTFIPSEKLMETGIIAIKKYYSYFLVEYNQVE